MSGLVSMLGQLFGELRASSRPYHGSTSESTCIVPSPNAYRPKARHKCESNAVAKCFLVGADHGRYPDWCHG